MQHELTSLEHAYGAGRASLASYAAGFFFSIVLTLIPYTVAREGLLEGGELLAVITVFALLQLFVQMYFFLHLNASSKARWNLVAMGFTLFMVAFLVIGTLWIMQNLAMNMSPDMQRNMSDLRHGD